MKNYCMLCGAKMVKDKIYSYSYDTGEPIWLLACPKRSLWESFRFREHSTYLENAIHSWSSKK